MLKEIAQKVQNYQNFYGGKKLESKEEKQSKELEHKIDDIVEKTFEKLNEPISLMVLANFIGSNFILNLLFKNSLFTKDKFLKDAP